MLKVDIHKQLNHFHLYANFSMNREIAVLFGPSGSGKTTILNCIAGLTHIDTGSITLNKRTFVENGKSLIPVHQRNIGYVFQNYALFPHMTVWENISYGMKTDKLVHKLMDELQIQHLKRQFPHQISGGEKQRVAFIRALATKPDLLLLDEPFSALDHHQRTLAHEQLLHIHQKWNIPILLVTHKRDETEKLADIVFMIHEGQVIKSKHRKY